MKPNLTLPVLKEQPEGTLFNTFPPAIVISQDRKLYYYCKLCGGWIRGEYHRRHVSDLGPLSGRQGDAIDCIRCGKEIDFSGIVS